MKSLVSLFLVLAIAGCISKEKAREQARAAFLAGEQHAMEQMRQNQGSNVTFTGPVRNPLVPWTAELTLAKALIAADYFGQQDPAEIIIKRGEAEIHVDPKKLLGGEDVPLQPHDIIDLKE